VKTVLLTGAGGSVGGFLRQPLSQQYRLRLSDNVEIECIHDNESFVLADASNLDDMLAASEGVDAIIHMGGVSRESDWESIFQVNIGGAYNVYEAARINNVARVIFPSSNHAVGFYRRDQKIPVETMLRPDSRYGVSKAFGEAIGSLYADKYGLKVLCLRIGNVAEKPVDRRRLSIWISPRDLTQLVNIGLQHPDLHFAVMYGVSGNGRSWYADEFAQKFGYRPMDNSEHWADEVLAESPPLDASSIADQHQGGDFCVTEEGGGSPLKKTDPKT